MILTKVKVQSISNVNIPYRESNIFIIGTIRLGVVYVCDDIHNEIMDTIFSREELYYDEFLLEGEVEISDDESECNENNVSI